MPHIIIKMASGRSEEQKNALAAEITKAVTTIAICKEEAVSVAIEEFAPESWTEEVYKPDILGAQGKLYKKPGYNPL